MTNPPMFGDSLILAHVPKKDGSVRVVPLVNIVAGGAWHVVASASGSKKHPAWVFGLRRHQEITVEVPGTPIETVQVSVTELDPEGEDRADIWNRFARFSYGFDQLERMASPRVIPIFRLTRI